VHAWLAVIPHGVAWLPLGIRASAGERLAEDHRMPAMLGGCFRVNAVKPFRKAGLERSAPLAQIAGNKKPQGG